MAKPDKTNDLEENHKRKSKINKKQSLEGELLGHAPRLFFWWGLLVAFCVFLLAFFVSVVFLAKVQVCKAAQFRQD